MGECHWICVDIDPPTWAWDFRFPPNPCEWPQQCIEPEEEPTSVGQTAVNDCREDPS